MATVTLNATAAVHIELDNPTSNFNGNAFITIGEWNGGAQTDRGLLNFNVAGAGIPSNATITTVTLRIYDEGLNYSSNDRTMRVYRLLRSFTNTQCTWNKADSSTNWGTAGCANTTTDREATDVGSISMPATEVTGYNDITLTTASIQDVVAGTFTFRGYLVKMDTESNDMHQFSDDNDANPPQLVINYTVPGGSPMFFDGGVTIG